MRYKMLLRDAIILTDDYESDEMAVLRRNLQEDMRSLGISYPVSVLNEHNMKVFTLLPIE